MFNSPLPKLHQNEYLQEKRTRDRLFDNKNKKQSE